MGHALVADPQRWQWAVIPASASTVTPKGKERTHPLQNGDFQSIFINSATVSRPRHWV